MKEKNFDIHLPGYTINEGINIIMNIGMIKLMGNIVL